MSAVLLHEKLHGRIQGAGMGARAFLELPSAIPLTPLLHGLFMTCKRQAWRKRTGMSKLTHIDDTGAARMVDVSQKDITRRTARAGGHVFMQPETFATLMEGAAKKGDVLAVARIAGIMAAKRTHELIPLCHPLPITKVTVDFIPDEATSSIAVQAMCKVDGKTGIEMEALTAVSVACLTIYDMLKAVDRAMRITDIRLLEKKGGKSGHYIAKEDQ